MTGSVAAIITLSNVLASAQASLVQVASGAPLLAGKPLPPLPSRAVDASNVNMQVFRNRANHIDKGPAHTCEVGDDKDTCLGHPDRNCMWTMMETRDPTKLVQERSSHCMPCELDGEELPCQAAGSFVNGKYVVECEMSCPHQKTVWQPEYACGDETGFITHSQCFDKGVQSGSKCMFMEYEDQHGNKRSSCGACEISGTGMWGCPAVGSDGPLQNSTTTFCQSQCEQACIGPHCAPTVAPPPPSLPPSPGAVQTSADSQAMLSAPVFRPMPTVNPFEAQMAAIKAMKAAGWSFTTPMPQPSYQPVVVYRDPRDYLPFTTPMPYHPLYLKQSEQEVKQHKAHLRKTQ